MAINMLLLASLASAASAVKLYAASYSGTVTTLELTRGLSANYSGSASLQASSVNRDCGGSPSWLTIDNVNGKKILYCVDEGNTTPNASLNTLTINSDGSLKQIANVSTITGPVSSQFYNHGNESAVALAHYSGSAISTFLRTPEGKLTPLQNFTFSTPPGPRPEQDHSHVHEAIIDPTGQYLLFPDLGADLVRVYGFDPATSRLLEQTPLKQDAGSGPRHATFWSPTSGSHAENSTLYLFIIHELGNFISSYGVKYGPQGGLIFDHIQDIGLYGNRTKPDGTRAAEIVVSPDNRFIIASNRNATIFNVTNPDPKNSTQIPSDSLTTFKPSADGKLTFQNLAPSGGSFPRHFSLNKKGDMVAIGNQNSEQVSIWSRDVETGKFGERVAYAAVPGQVTNVIWDES